jgi:ATP-dependent Lhr-like helicase
MQYHIVNTLGWRQLRPLQDHAIGPVLDGEHGMFLAPTAGGKTEAAAFPVFSRMATEEWRPLSVLYLAPLRALLNNLEPRLTQYAGFVGRRVGLWHGDTSQSARARMIGDPPDLLLTTPESLEAMLISRRVNERWLFPHLRTVVIDEVHAFAAADRGWHLLAVLERLTRLAGRDLQRIGLSATVGNPDELLDWLCGSSRLPRRIVNPPAESVAEPEVALDYVGTLSNAVTVINRLHRGEKRLVFVDSRRRAEELAHALGGLGTTVFVSHGSLGQEERRRSEQAFAEASNCVIVATSTLELGIDVGDLDRVIQIDSPPTVAGFLQRIGRTGRRPGTSRNALFLATSGESLLTAAGLLRLWASGYVEPAEPPAMPAHLVAQQVLALTLQEADEGLPLSEWASWLGDPPVLGQAAMARAQEVVAHLLAEGWLFDDGGVLGPGPKAEKTIGQRNFLELMSVFVSDPLVSVRQGRVEIGQVPDLAITAALGMKPGPPRLLLAGRSWKVNDIDWKRRVAQVDPADEKASVRFPGLAQPLSYELCQAVAEVLGGATLDPVAISTRAAAKLGELRDSMPRAQASRTLLVRDAEGLRWFTFAGLRANLELAARLDTLRSQITQRDNLSITLDPDVGRESLEAARSSPTPSLALAHLVEDVAGALKLQNALPETLVRDIMVERLTDPDSVTKTALAPVDYLERGRET